MRRFLFALFLVLFVGVSSRASAQVERRESGALVTEGIPEVPGWVEERLQSYQNTRQARLVDWLPGGDGVLIRTRFGETEQLHVVGAPGGAREQLTFYAEPVREAAVCPNGSYPVLLFVKDVGGNENYQLYSYDYSTGVANLLSDGESRNGSVVWEEGSSRFAFYSTQRNGRDWDVYTGSLDHYGEFKRVLAKGGAWTPKAFSPDGRKLLVHKYVSITESYYHVLDLESGDLQPVGDHTQITSYGPALWDRRGEGIFLVSDAGQAYKVLRYVPLGEGEERLVSAAIPWDVEALDLSPDGDLLAFAANEGGLSKLYLLATDSFEVRPLTTLPQGIVGNLDWHPRGRSLAVELSSATGPGDVYELEVGTGKVTRWTQSEVGGLDRSTFVAPTLIEYPTFDEVGGKPRMIPAFVYRPGARARQHPIPVVILIHGGPEAQYRPRFSAQVQYWVNELGVAVIAPNVRGSDGYGKEYVTLDNGFRREDSVKDIGALLDWVEGQDDLDAERVCLFGGSYGGYMVASSMAHFNDRLKCAIDVVGISNFVTFLKNTKEYRRDLRRVEYGDEREPGMGEFLTRISPTTNAARIRKPMFIAQGANDPRVPESESTQMVAQVRKNGTPVWYMLARDEGHGFAKKRNRDYFLAATVLFLESFLLD